MQHLELNDGYYYSRLSATFQQACQEAITIATTQGRSFRYLHDGEEVTVTSTSDPELVWQQYRRDNPAILLTEPLLMQLIMERGWVYARNNPLRSEHGLTIVSAKSKNWEIPGDPEIEIGVLPRLLQTPLFLFAQNPILFQLGQPCTS